jgi:hypothetical protein
LMMMMMMMVMVMMMKMKTMVAVYHHVIDGDYDRMALALPPPWWQVSALMERRLERALQERDVKTLAKQIKGIKVGSPR